jgi:choline dehydrogenase-like flavoprotein
MLHVSAYPTSSGHVHITGASLSDKIDFDAGYLSDKNQVDVKMLVWVYKKARELVRRMKTYRGEFASWHPNFPDGSAAACIRTEKPLEGGVQDLEYTPEDDAAIEQFLREKIVTMNHSMGTCKMAPLEKGGVVDSRLNVYGVKSLKVCDLGILPRNVAANTASTALAIGEKTADMIIQDLGLSG